MSITPVKRKRLETQGFIGLNDEVLGEVEPWLRLSPALCTILIGLGTALAFAPLLWVMVAFAGLGAIFPAHPFDLIYNYGLRYLSGTRRLPPNGAPRRFACGLAAAWLVGTALAFQVGVVARICAGRSPYGCRTPCHTHSFLYPLHHLSGTFWAQ